jgi:transposase
MKVCYELRGDRKYAYKVTSKREPGKKYPTTIKEYLGVVDPDTGNLIPKKTRSDDVKFTLADGRFRTKDYGNVILIDKVAKDLGILDDLSHSFGSADRAMMVLAMAQALSPTPFMDTKTVIESTYIRETVGLGEMDLSSQRLSEMTKIIGEAGGCMEDLFTLRVKRSGGMFLYDLTSQSTYSELEGMAEWGKNRDGEAMRQINVGMATDREGVPVAFDIFPGSVADTSTLKRFVDDMQRRCPGSMLIMDRGFESASNVGSLMANGIDFVMPCTVSSKVLKKLVTDFSKDATKPEYDRMHDGHVYSVCERGLGIMRTKDGSEYVADDDADYENCTHKVHAYVCFDSKKRNDDEQELKSALMGKIKELDGRKFENPARSFAKRTKWMSKYLEYTLDGEGKMKVGYKNNAMAFFRNRAGMFVLMTPSADWETAMCSYDARNNVEMAFDIYKNDLDGHRGRTGDPERARGRFFIKFLALMIRVRMQTIVSKSKLKDLTVNNAILATGTYKIIDDGGLRIRTEKTKRVREILDLFGVEDPEQLPLSCQA